jgi:predicted nucleotidyltransferase
MAIAERWKGHRPLPADLETRLPLAVDRLRDGGAELVYVFGSVAASPTPGHEPTDLDLAVWGLSQDRWKVLADIGEALGTDRVDLVLLEEAEAELRFKVISEGRLLYRADLETENRIELRFVREYQDLAPFRRVQSHYLRARYTDHGA